MNHLPGEGDRPGGLWYIGTRGATPAERIVSGQYLNWDRSGLRSIRAMSA